MLGYLLVIGPHEPARTQTKARADACAQLHAGAGARGRRTAPRLPDRNLTGLLRQSVNAKYPTIAVDVLVPKKELKNEDGGRERSQDENAPAPVFFKTLQESSKRWRLE
jgi:hypothetical protein